MKETKALTVLAALMLAVTACGGDKPVERSCEEHVLYKQAREHPAIEVPEGMSGLDPEREMQVPEPSPQAGRPADAPCLDLPPSVLVPEEQADEEADEEAVE